jgi:hypothetical protein
MSAGAGPKNQSIKFLLAASGVLRMGVYVKDTVT